MLSRSFRDGTAREGRTRYRGACRSCGGAGAGVRPSWQRCECDESGGRSRRAQTGRSAVCSRSMPWPCRSGTVLYKTDQDSSTVYSYTCCRPTLAFPGREKVEVGAERLVEGRAQLHRLASPLICTLPQHPEQILIADRDGCTAEHHPRAWHRSRATRSRSTCLPDLLGLARPLRLQLAQAPRGGGAAYRQSRTMLSPSRSWDLRSPVAREEGDCRAGSPA